MIPRANTVYSFRIMTAGLVAEIVTEYRPAEFLYADFRTDKPFDFQIELTDDDLDMDIVETGTTLKENNLAVLETIVPISARLIANKAGFLFKTGDVEKLICGLRKEVEEP